MGGLFVAYLGNTLGASDWLIAGLRQGIAGVPLLGIYLWRCLTHRTALLSWRSIAWSCVAGIACLLLSNILALYVMATMGLTSAVVFLNTSVVFTLVFGCTMSRKRSSLVQTLGSALAFGGAVLVTMVGSGADIAIPSLLPVLAGLGSGAAMGAYPFVTTLEVVVAAGCSWVALAESFGLWKWVGVAAIIVASALVNLGGAKGNEDAEAEVGDGAVPEVGAGSEAIEVG